MRTSPRLLLPLLLALVLPLGGCAPAQVAPSPSPATPAEPSNVSNPDVIALPNGFQPEGISAKGDVIYVGSIPTGAIYRADVTTGAGTIVVPAATGRAAVGLKIDSRSDRLFVCGGATGKAFVYDTVSGTDLASYTLNETTQTFINDVVLTDGAAYFTDSRKAALYRVAIPAEGALGGQDAVSAVPLTGDFQFQSGALNLNGIVNAGDRLIAVQTATGLLFTIDPATGATRRIDLGTESVPNGDGLLLVNERTLLVVQNQLNTVAVVDLAPDLGTGTVRTRIKNPAFDVPTTLAAVGTSVYAVNARFGTTATASTPYSVVKFAKP